MSRNFELLEQLESETKRLRCELAARFREKVCKLSANGRSVEEELARTLQSSLANA